jgi:PRTRC genetic system protein C
MALEVTNLTREFTFKKNGTLITLADPNPELSVEEVLQSYSGQYPEFTTATIEGPKVEGSKAVYNAKTTVGTKG